MAQTYRHVPASIHLPGVVRLKCDKCGRRGQYSRQRYLDISGSDVGDLLDFARAVGCETALRQESGEWYDRCGIVFDWTPEQMERIMKGERP